MAGVSPISESSCNGGNRKVFNQLFIKMPNYNNYPILYALLPHFKILEEGIMIFKHPVAKLRVLGGEGVVGGVGGRGREVEVDLGSC